MKNLIKNFKEYRYKKRLKKWFEINRRLFFRKIKRALCTKEFLSSLKSSHAIVAYLSVFIIAAVSVLCVLFTEHAMPYFDSDAKIIRRLSITGLTNNEPYLEALTQFGSTNRIQVTLKTEKDSHLKPVGTSLEKGGVNLVVTFKDGTTQEYSLKNSNYQSYGSNYTDTFTLILPYGYTPFDVEEYTLAVLPDVKNDYGTWHCAWARVYFLLENEPVLLAKEDWEGTALFGAGEDAVKKSTLTLMHDRNESFVRSETLYNYYLKLAAAGMSNFDDEKVKSDVLDSLGFNGGKYLYIDIETADIENQNDILTYHTKGASIPESDSLDYDGLMYLDITFYTPLEDGSFSESFLLDTLGTDDYELGTTSSFKIEMPKGKCVFDINTVTLRAENPYDAWAPRYIRMYIKPDYAGRLEIARLNDTMLINDYSTPVFYRNLIEPSVKLDLSTQFKISDTVKKELESENKFSLGGKISSMYFDLQSFYDRQITFFKQMVEIYSPGAFEQEQETETPVTEPEPSEQEEDSAQPDETVRQEQEPETQTTPETEQTPEAEQSSESPQTPEAPQTPEVEQTPEAPQTPEVEQTPEAEQTPEVEVTPGDETVSNPEQSEGQEAAE